MSHPSLLEVEGLWKIFGDDRQKVDVHDPGSLDRAAADGAVAAVRDVSLRVNRGEVFVIMGLSGSGKSTLIRCLLRLIEPTAGRVLMDGEDVTGMSEAHLREVRRSRVAMVFQHYGLLPHRTVLENVAFGLKLRGVPKSTRDEEARKAVEMVGLAGWEDRHPRNLSGGMQQRVGLARALVQDAGLLLMDEPFSGLDPLIRREMQDELIRIQEELHKAILFVTHDLSEALFLGDRMAVMRDGSFVQVGRPQEILKHPADEYVRRFVQDERRVADLAAEGRPANVRNIEEHRRQPGLEEKQAAAGR